MPAREHRSDEDDRRPTRDGPPQHAPASTEQGRAPRARSRQTILVIAILTVPVVLVVAVAAVAIAIAVFLYNRVTQPTMAGAEIQWLAVSPGGRYVSGIPYFGEHRLIVWDAGTGDWHGTISLPSPPPWVDGYAVAPDGRQVAVLIDRKVVFYSLPDGQVERTVQLSPWQGGDDRSPWITYTPDGTAVVTAFEQALVRVDRATGAETVVLTRLRTGGVRYAADADRVVELGPHVAGKGREVRVVDPARGPLSAFWIKELEYQFDREFGVSADGTVVAVGATSLPDGVGPATVHVYDTRTGGRVASFPIVPAGASPVHFKSIRLSPNGGLVAVSAKIWDAQETVVRILGDVRTGQPRPFGPAGEPPPVLGTSCTDISAFGPDGKWFAYRVRDGVRIYDVDAGGDR
jgi:WD40 repeat protein